MSYFWQSEARLLGTFNQQKPEGTKGILPTTGTLVFSGLLLVWGVGWNLLSQASGKFTDHEERLLTRRILRITCPLKVHVQSRSPGMPSVCADTLWPWKWQGHWMWHGSSQRAAAQPLHIFAGYRWWQQRNLNRTCIKLSVCPVDFLNRSLFPCWRSPVMPQTLHSQILLRMGFIDKTRVKNEG